MTVSRQKAIFEQCHQCVAIDKKHSWVKDVEECQGYSCCLYHIRPVSDGKGRKTEAHNVEGMLVGWSPDIANYLAPSLLQFLSRGQSLEAVIVGCVGIDVDRPLKSRIDAESEAG